MTMKQLSSLFTQSINWNAIFYGFYKLLFTLLSFLLYRTLSQADFSTWANITSIIYLLLLWIDCGLRKSLPRFCPEFAKSPHHHRLFIRSIILFYNTVLILAIPIFWYLSGTLAHFLHLQHHINFFYLACVIFFIEGLGGLFKLIYHSHFKVKQFTIINSLTLTIETITNCILIYYIEDSSLLLQALFATKIISGSVLIALACWFLNTMYQDHNYTHDYSFDPIKTRKSFIKHSAIMWTNTNIKSLSERNFMIPLLTHSLGPAAANLFKLANDSALLFHRTITKTIGTNDTTLLAHSVATDNQQEFLQEAFQKLMNTVQVLCCLIFGVIIACITISWLFSINQHGLELFCIIITGYLIETLLSPFERILEIKGNYYTLWLSYAPYSISVITLMALKAIPWLGLANFLIIIHSTRMLGSLLMTYWACRQHQITITWPSLNYFSLLKYNK